VFKINKKVEYAFMALMHIHEKQPHELTSVKEICDCCGSPFDVTSRSMQKMVSANLLKSEKGAHGGYSLIQDLSQINVLQFIEMVVEPVSVVDCAKADNTCALASSCNVVTPLLKLNEKLRHFFSELTLKELLETEKAALTTEVI
jgi:Rrf2 family transcriptional regulator, nitric oxide-sensitive transcriptional repressor